MTYLVEHDIRMPVRQRGGPGKGELEWRRVNRATLLNLFANPIYAGVYAYGVRAVQKRRQQPGRPGTGRDRRAPERPRFFCMIGCPPTSASSAMSAIRCS